MTNESRESLLERQVELELEMQGMGVTRFREALSDARARGEESGTSHGNHLLRAAIEPVATGITEFVAKVNSGKVGRRNLAAKYLEQIDPEVAALIISKVIIDQITFRNPLPRAALKVASQLEDDVRFRKFEAEATGLYKWLERNNKTSNRHHKRTVMVYTMNNADVEWQEWSKTDKMHLGIKAIELFCHLTGLAEIRTRYEGKNKSVLYIEATSETMDWILNKNNHAELLWPVYLPTLLEPKDWTTPYDGGYHTKAVHPLTLVKTRNRNYLEEISNRVDEMPHLYNTINTLQRTPWKINKDVLDVLMQSWELSLSLGKIPSREDYEIPPAPIDGDVKAKDLEGQEKEDFIAWKRRAADVHEKNVKLRSKRLQIAKIMTIANKFKDESAIFFPHTYDFRGRVYAVPMFLQPQGSDIAKGCLTFAEGKPLGTEEAADWLAIHGANLFGYDKVSLEDRALWAHLNTERVIAAATDPLAHQWWADADKPWQFLAWCFEWKGYTEDGLNHISHIPVALDGSCNGIQHYSAALLDGVGGKSVNLTPSPEPQDIYQDVADVAIGKLRLLLSTEASNEEKQLAQQWLDWGITRKDTKRSVMVLPYGGTLFSCRKFIEDRIEERIDDGDASPFGDQSFDAAVFLAKVVWASIGEVVVAARGAMDWLQKAARVLAKEGLPIVWRTPDGFPVMQAYNDQRRKRVETQFGDRILKLSLRQDLPTLNKVRQTNGIAPNFVHSADGTALRMCVGIAGDQGIKSFAMVHDSYGTLAADTETLSHALRVAFVDMYKSTDVLQSFKDEVEALLPEGKELPPLPEKGTLDLDLVLESRFFFA